MTKYINPSHRWDTYTGELEVTSGDLSETLSLQVSASYIIYKDGNIVKAMNGKTKVVEFSGRDAITIIQKALDALTPGRTWKERVVLKGDFTLTDTIRLPSYTIFDFSQAILRHGKYLDATITNKNLNDPSEGIEDQKIEIIGGIIDARYSALGVGNEGINFVSAKDIHIKNVVLLDGYGDAIDLDNCENVLVENILVKDWGGSAVHVSDSGPGFTSYKGCSYVTVRDSYAENVGKEMERAAFNVWVRSSAIGGGLYNTFKNLVAVDCYMGFAFSNEIGGYNEAIRITVINSSYRGISITGAGKNKLISPTVIGSGSHGIITFAPEIEITNPTIHNPKYYGIVVAANDVKIRGGQVSNPLTTGYAGIRIEDALRTIVSGVRIFDTQSPKKMDYAIEEYGTSDYSLIIGNDVTEGGGILKVGSHTIVRHNHGYPTENSGTATITAGSTSVTVSHGLAGTPSKVLVTPIGDPGDRYWVANITDTSFDIVVATAPAADITFYWEAQI